jgi:hypothetical protein
MDLDEFRKDFLESVVVNAEVSGDFTEASFVTTAAQRLVDAGELADFEPCHAQGAGSRNRKFRVDGYHIDDSDDFVCLLVARFFGGETTETLNREDIIRVSSFPRVFIEESFSGNLTADLEESSPGYQLARLLHERRGDIAKIRAILVTDAVLSERMKELPQEVCSGIPVEFQIWDISRFHKIFESESGREDLVINFQEVAGAPIPCIKASSMAEDYKAAYLCAMPASVIADIYDSFGSRLLEGNVRSFLSIRTKVNKGIRASILNEPAMFFVYNNGISATANSADIRDNGNACLLFSATNFQIVNGGQTTAAIALARRKDRANLAQIFVQVKISVVSQHKAETVIPKIAFCANSQNKVSDADFFSNHPFQVRMEEVSRRIWAPRSGSAQHDTHWFFERARGQYLNEQLRCSAAEKRKFVLQNPRKQLVSKTDFAKYDNTWRCVPHIVSLGAQKNFARYAEWIDTKWQGSETQFNDGYFRDIVAKAIIFRHTEHLVSKASWYQGGYRANIVTYALSKLVDLVRDRVPEKTIDLNRIWSNQKVSDGLSAQIELISERVFQSITNPPPQIQNVTEWCKKSACWDRIRDLDIPVLPVLLDSLIETDVVAQSMNDARRQARQDSGIHAQTEVVSLGEEYWTRLLKWCVEKNRLSNSERELIRRASNGGRPLSPRDSGVLLVVRKKAADEGFS